MLAAFSSGEACGPIVKAPTIATAPPKYQDRSENYIPQCIGHQRGRIFKILQRSVLKFKKILPSYCDIY
ncbi:hypothetical protein F3J20_26025 [Paraburkholderia sp. Cy-641]|nr:hypothetical protein [Paraburkholderia sp. Cy-641]